jgi:hypothetical protein
LILPYVGFLFRYCPYPFFQADVDNVDEILLSFGRESHRFIQRITSFVAEGTDSQMSTNNHHMSPTSPGCIVGSHVQRKWQAAYLFGDVADDLIWNFLELRKVSEPLKCLEQNQEAHSCREGPTDITRQFQFIGRGRIDFTQILRCDRSLESRIGGFVNAGHGCLAA